MDIFDRLGGFIEDILDRSATTGANAPKGDPDYNQAWDELDAYLNEDERERPVFTATDRSGVPGWLNRDFRNLEVPPGTPLPEVRKAYKRLLTAFHPDRHAGSDKQTTATLVTQKLNESFARIRDYYESTSGTARS